MKSFLFEKFFEFISENFHEKKTRLFPKMILKDIPSFFFLFRFLLLLFLDLVLHSFLS
jgi:hypothetical protein